MTTPKLLLVSPVFHGYWETIKRSLEKLGYEVVPHLYDAPGNMNERVKNKLIHDLPERLRPASAETSVTDQVITAFHTARPDIVLTVKGDILGAEWWDTLQSSGVRYATWMYDELRRMRYTEQDYARLGAIASYSPLDVQTLQGMGVEALEVPLAYDSDMPISTQPSEAITFVGARYAGREEMLRGLAQQGIPVKAYGKQWSRHPWDIARTRRWAHPGIPTGRDLDRSHAYGLMAASPATLNIHGDQDGFTMRTFEASGVGGLQIVDRPEVSRYYSPGEEVLVYESVAELVEICQRVLSDKAWAEKIRSAGFRRTQTEHTFNQRIRSLEQLWA